MTHTIAEEATIKTLSVMTKADTNIAQVEVDTVQAVLKKEMGIEMSSADIRVAAHDEFIEDRAIGKYLKKIESKLTLDDKKLMMLCLVKVIKADDRTSEAEATMFNSVADALKLTPADLVSL